MATRARRKYLRAAAFHVWDCLSLSLFAASVPRPAETHTCCAPHQSIPTNPGRLRFCGSDAVFFSARARARKFPLHFRMPTRMSTHTHTDGARRRDALGVLIIYIEQTYHTHCREERSGRPTTGQRTDLGGINLFKFTSRRRQTRQLWRVP